MAVRRQRRKLTRCTWRGRMVREWTKKEICFLRKYYPKYETAWVAEQLGRTVYSVRYKASDLMVRKASPSVYRGNRGSANAFKNLRGWKNC